MVGSECACFARELAKRGGMLPLHILLDLIQNLPDRYRLVFNLFELDNYSHKEISNLLSISEGTSKSNLHRAKLILKEKINEINTSQNTLKNHGY